MPDSQGKFAIEVSDLAACKEGGLRVEFCHANGAISNDGSPSASLRKAAWIFHSGKCAKPWEPIADAVASNQPDTARAALLKLETGKAPDLTLDIARKLVSTLATGSKLNPSVVPAKINKLPLGDANPQNAKVGWLKPAANRVPVNNEIKSPLLDSGKIYATGLYAHSPSIYVYDLGGKWKKLRGEAGLHTTHQPYGNVVFVIKADDKEIFRSPVIRGSAKASYDIDIAGVKTLELIVEKANQSNGGNWGLWLDPTLSRDAGTDTAEKR